MKYPTYGGDVMVKDNRFYIGTDNGMWIETRMDPVALQTLHNQCVNSYWEAKRSKFIAIVSFVFTIISFLPMENI